jgi:hypothetical protein
MAVVLEEMLSAVVGLPLIEMVIEQVIVLLTVHSVTMGDMTTITGQLRVIKN